MNMQKILLEAMSATDDEAIRREANEYLANLAKYVFPIDGNNVTSSTIQNRVQSGKPVDFQWAATEFAENGASRDPKFLFDLGKSLLPQKDGTSLFFENANESAKASYKAMFPHLAAMEGGPSVFEMFLHVISGGLVEEADNTVTTKFGDDGSADTTKRDDDTGLRDIIVKYYTGLESQMKQNYKFVLGNTSSADNKQYNDAVLYAAYIGCIFQSLNDARKQISDSDGSKSRRAPISTVLGNGARNIVKTVISSLPASSTGSLDNWGSIYNEGKNVLKVIDPTRINKVNISEFRVYPQYVIDVLRLRDGSRKTLVDILRKNHAGEYEGIANAFDKLAGAFDNKILPITTAEFVKMLSDSTLIKECFQANIGEIFTKNGAPSWASPNGASSLGEVLESKVRMNSADEKNPRAVGITKGPSLKHANTSREYTGDGIVAQTYKDMVIGRAVVTKTPIGKVIAFTTTDTGTTHKLKVGPNLEKNLNDTDFKNVIARKVVGGGEDNHEYFICVPRGISFATMQDDEGTIVRNENMNTLCMGLKLNGKDFKYSSVNKLMESPIGKYCNAVKKLGKVGRLRFSSAEANSAYGKVLEALRKMKTDGQVFNSTTTNRMSVALGQLDAVLSATVQDKTERAKILKPFLTKGLTLRVERYNPATGKFEFKYTPSIASHLIEHLGDMYNIDTVDGYTTEDAKLILEAITPNKWNLSEWNYANVLRASAALNGTADESTDVAADDLGGDAVGDEDVKPIDQALDDNLATQTADDGGLGADAQDDDEIAGNDIGSGTMDTIKDAIQSVYEKLFPAEKPTTAHQATAMKNALVSKLSEMKEENTLNVPGIEQSVSNINDYTDFTSFIKKLGAVVYDAVKNQPDADDKTVRMGFFADSDMSTQWVVDVVKNVLARRLPQGVKGEDAALIPEIGGLMVKFAVANAGSTNAMEQAFDRDYLVSTFESTFTRESNAQKEYLADLSRKINGATTLDASKRDALAKELAIANHNVALYQKVENKVESDLQFVGRVADIIVQNTQEIVNAVRGTVSHIDDEGGGSFVLFDAASAASSRGAGLPVIDFCLYDTEGLGEQENLNKLNIAFSNNDVASMMDALYNSVPSESISMDAIRDEKSLGDLKANQLSLMQSYFGKATANYNRGLANQIKDIYLNKMNIHGMFNVDDGSGKTSPYSYKGEQIDLDKVKTFFDSLMRVADSYNDGQQRIQATMNNEEYNKHALHNPYFIELKSRFNDVYTKSKERQPFTPADKNVMDLVMRQVVSNPMNILINNNVKLVTAYAYQKEIVTKGQGSMSQTSQVFGFGSGPKVDTSIKGTDVEPSLKGLSRNLDKTLAVLELAENLTQFKTFSKDTLKSAFSAAGGKEKAEADYKSYLASIDDNGDHIRVLLNKVLNEKDPAKRENTRYDILQKEMVFCTYGADMSKAADVKRIVNLRTAELMVLLYQTAYDIWKDIPKSDYEQIIDALNASRKVLNSDIIKKVGSMVPQELLDRFRNLDAELQLADPTKRNRDVFGFRNSNNDKLGSDSDVMHDVKRYPENRTSDIVDELLTDKPLDVGTFLKLFDASGLRGDAGKSGTSIMRGNCSVKSGNNELTISSSIILYSGDIILFTVDGVTEPAFVTGSVPNAEKVYTTTKVYGVPESNKMDVPFVRFQLKNKLVGGQMQDKADAVLGQLNEWYDDYKDSDVPDYLMQKLIWLKYLFAGSGCANAIKALVAYCVWKVGHYAYELKPKEFDVGGDIANGKYRSRLINLIAADMKQFKQTDKRLYDEIQDIAMSAGLMSAIRNSTTLSTPEDVKGEGTAEKKLIETTAVDTDTKNILRKFVERLGAQTGFVQPEYVYDALSDVMSSSQGAQGLIDLSKGAYKTELDAIIKEHNWRIARPLVDAYKRSLNVNAGETPTLDGAVKFVKDNYVQKTYKNSAGDTEEFANRDAFANYLKTTCKNDINFAISN